MQLGAHVGVAGGMDKAPGVAKGFGCETLQIFSKSPQMWKGPPIVDEVAERFRAAVRSEGLAHPSVHHAYLLNLANPTPALYQRSLDAFIDELGRAEKLGADYLIFHPGAHLGSGVEPGLQRIADGLDHAIEATSGFKVRALLENAAGQGSTLGSKFEELAWVLDHVQEPSRVGVALDTCHLFASGFDFRTEEGYDAMIESLDRSVRSERVFAFHLNDAKAELGSNLDRHENIGNGKIGLDGFRRFVNDGRWAAKPGYLETPLDEDGYSRYAADLTTLRGLITTGPKKPGTTARPKPPKRPPATGRR